MEPLYFPFTYIPDAALRVLAACFKSTAVYQPSSAGLPAGMCQWAEREIIRVRVPVQGDDNRLAQVCRSYYDWARLHQGTIANFLGASREAIPFFEETSAFRIRADIDCLVRAGDAESKTAETSEDLLFKARLFLQIAQDYDIQCQGLQSQLQSVEKMQQDLFRNLNGGRNTLEDPAGDEASGQAVSPSLRVDVADYGIENRLTAWVRLLREDRGRFGLFVTGSRAVIEYIVEKMPQVRRIADIPVCVAREAGSQAADRFQEELREYLETLTSGGSPESIAAFAARDTGIPGGRALLSLYLAAGKAPLELFSCCLDDSDSAVMPNVSAPGCGNTVLGLIEY